MSCLPAGYLLRVATADDFPAVRAFYNELIDELLRRPYHPLWDRNGHPSDSYLQGALAADELWVAEYESEGIVAALVVNHAANEGYLAVPWSVQAAPHEAAIVHAFGVHNRHQGQGLGSAIMRCVIEHARSRGDKAVRLDLIDYNLPVQRAYLKLGFVKRAEVNLYYKEVGWHVFHMFEYVL